MPSSILKEIVPTSMYLEFLITNCNFDERNNLLLDRNCFKRSKVNETLFPFLSSLLPFYHSSTQHYLTRSITYTRFLTIIRQLLKQSEIRYETSIVHTSSTKEVTLLISPDSLPT